MAKIRVGFSSDFNVRDTKVGFGTTNPAALLDVPDTLKADFNITGVTTLTAYGGFVAQNQYVNKSAAIGFATIGVGEFQQYYETETGFTNLGGVHHGDDQKFNTLSEDLIIDDGKILNITNISMFGTKIGGEKQDSHSHSSYVCAGSLEQVSVTGHFSVPNGGTNDRKDNPIEGTVRFNTDLNTLEFYNGIEWRQFTVTGASGRGVFGGGVYGGGYVSTSSIEFININSLGNSTNFGVLTDAKSELSSCSNSTRGLFGGGRQPAGNSPQTGAIEYITIASEGNSIDFGTLDVARYGLGGCSSSTRGLFGGGYVLSGGNKNEIDYVEIGTLGSAIDFGDLTINRRYPVSFSSSTRGFWGHGITPASPFNRTTIIDYVTMSSKGDAVEFGNLSYAVNGSAGLSNSVRGVFAGGAYIDYYLQIEYITLSSNGNSTYFGDLSQTSVGIVGASTQTRGVFAHGNSGISPFPRLNAIDYITITSAGNAIDFGDLSVTRSSFAGLSDSHGGLGGF